MRGRCAHGPPADLGGLDELEDHREGHREPTPFVTFLRSRTAAKADSLGLVARRWEAKPDGPEKAGPASVPDDADPFGNTREINSPSAHANMRILRIDVAAA